MGNENTCHRKGWVGSQLLSKVTRETLSNAKNWELDLIIKAETQFADIGQAAR
jgi:hypothetical protein